MATMSKAQPQIAALITVVEAFARARDVSNATASGQVLGRGGRLETLRQGQDMGVIALNRAMQFMSDNWPEDSDTKWPEGIERPKPVRTEAKPKRKR